MLVRDQDRALFLRWRKAAGVSVESQAGNRSKLNYRASYRMRRQRNRDVIPAI